MMQQNDRLKFYHIVGKDGFHLVTCVTDWEAGKKVGMLNWERAVQRCHDEYHGNLVTIHSQELQDFLTTFLLLPARGNIWIGLHDRDNESNYRWEDGSPVNYMNWEPTEPSGPNLEHEDCTELIYLSSKKLGHSGLWNDNDCGKEMQFICQREKGKQGKKYFDPRFCSPSRGGGWKFEDSCFHPVEERKTWAEAEEYCVEKYGGHLPTVKDLIVNLYLNYVLQELTEDAWIGIKLKDGIQQSWSSGWYVSYENWSEEPEECAVLSGDGKWSSRACKRELPFICEYSTVVPPQLRPGVEGSFCPEEPPDWRDLGGEYCYHFETKHHVNWPEANYWCMRRGGTLASIHSMEEINMMLNFVIYKVERVFIGLYRHMQHDEEFVWADGTPMDFTNWMENEPNNENEQCVEMVTDKMGWNDKDCGERRGFICSVPKISGNETNDMIVTTSCISGFTITALLGAMLCVLFVSVLMGVVVYYFRLCDRGYERVKKTSGTKLQSPSALGKKPRYRSEIVVQDDTYENVT